MSFERSKLLLPIQGGTLVNLLDDVAVSAGKEAGSAYYTPINDDDMAEFLAKTQVDRNRWRTAQPATATPQMVCNSFSALLWALVEQERLKVRGILFPMAFLRVRTLPNDIAQNIGHSLNGYINHKLKLRLVEPQNDAISDIDKFFNEKFTIQHILAI